VKSASDVADLLVTACPFCVSNLRVGNDLIKVNIDIKDITELIDDLLTT
jgi:Fe-S oxidoreductase